MLLSVCFAPQSHYKFRAMGEYLVNTVATHSESAAFNNSMLSANFVNTLMRPDTSIMNF